MGGDGPVRRTAAAGVRRRVAHEGVEGSIAWIRLLAAPFILLDAVTEEFPPGDEPWAWAIAATFTAGAVVLFAARRRIRDGSLTRSLGAAALIFDTTVVSAWAVLYAFEPGTPARELLVLVVVEAALRYGPPGALWSLATVPALALFERRLSATLDLPFDAGHAVFPAGLYLLVGLVVGTLARASGTAEPQ